MPAKSNLGIAGVKQLSVKRKSKYISDASADKTSYSYTASQCSKCELLVYCYLTLLNACR
jgi:hypothetical protein